MPETSPLPDRQRAAHAEARRAGAILMGMVAHDLRTPLHAMTGWLQMLTHVQDLPAATRERALKGLRQAVAQQVALADALTHVTAIETDLAEWRTADVDIHDAVRLAIATLATEADLRMVALRMADHEAPVNLASDFGLIAVLVGSLLSGTLKYATKNSLLTVAATRLATAPGCMIRVDLGRSMLPVSGIDALLRHLRGLESPAPAGIGAAFALAIAQRVILFLDGSLEVVAGKAPQQIILTVKLPDRTEKPT